MKTTSLLCTIITVAALLHRLSYADTPNHPSEPPRSESPGKTVRNRYSEEPHGSNNKKLAGQTPAEGTNRPNISGITMNNNSTIQKQLGGAGKTGLAENKVVSSSALPVRPPTVISFPGARTEKIHHHGANPAAIGGVVNSVGNTALINGTGINRKP